MHIPDFKILLKILLCVKNNKFSLEEISLITGIPISTISKIMMQFIDQGFLNIENGQLIINESSKIELATYLIKEGTCIEDVLSVVEWQNFELFIEKVLLEYGYKTFRSFRLKKPRLEVDVLALKENFGLAVDCKHWHKTISSSTLNSIVQRQIERAKIILSKEDRLLGKRFLVPVIVILYPSAIKFLGGVPIVPVEMFKSFVGEIDGRLSEVLKVYLDSGKVYAKI
jgi:hypothetical protein